MLGDSTIIAAKSAKTPYGAHNIIKSIILRITSFRESKKLLIGFDFFSGINIIEIPKIIAKNIT